jgi:hypothetical protein
MTFKIVNPHTNRKVEIPARFQRLCAQCLNPMPLHNAWWSSENTVELVYLCQHKLSARFKRVQATLDKKGRLS